MSLKPKVALSQDFLMQLSKLPSKVQSNVMKWALLFQSDPTSPGINYENINAARDANLKSVRITQDWRGIVFKPNTGDVYVLLYVGHHDDAYRWAQNRKLTINPVTGAMQLVLVETIEPEPTQASSSQEPTTEPTDPALTKLFADLEDRALLSLGVPEELLPQVHALENDSQLDALAPKLPAEAYEGLFLVAAGDTVSQILSARETLINAVIDTSDFAKALQTAESQSRFLVVDDDQEMQNIMSAPLDQWRVFLHPTQKKLATGDRSGPVRVLGGAGTGKTVLAMHRAKWLADNRTPQGKKVLFTTFTKNLASDIEQNLRTMCSSDTMEKIEVRNFDAWVHAFIRSRKLEHRIVYDRKQEGAAQAWAAALAVKDTTLDLPEDFYEKELAQIILAQGITTRDEYRVARRTGREGLLNRAKRDAVWPVFEEYRGQLSTRKLKEVDDAYREVAELLKSGIEPYDAYSAIVVDETQDFGAQALCLLRAMIPHRPNDLLFVGDGHQRIYSRNKAVMSQCGIDIRGRSRKLYLNYRTTDEIRRQAVALLEACEVDDLDGGHDETKRYRSLTNGPAPVITDAAGFEQAAALVIDFLKNNTAQAPETSETAKIPVHPLSICVITHSEKIREALAGQVQSAGFIPIAITAQSNHADSRGVIHFATMHRAKGLEFDSVIVVAPTAYFGAPEETANQRKLLYVALTRAKRTAAIVKLN